MRLVGFIIRMHRQLYSQNIQERRLSFSKYTLGNIIKMGHNYMKYES